MYMLNMSATEIRMSNVATKTTPEWEFGVWGNFADMAIPEVDQILSKIQPNFDPELDSPKRKRHDAFLFVKKHNLVDMDSIIAFEETQKQEKLKNVPADYQALGREAVVELLAKAKARVDLTKYTDGETWKLINILYKRVAEKFNGLSVEAFRALVIASKGGAGRGVPVIFNMNEPLPTLAPRGITPHAISVVEVLRAAYGEEIEIIGRNKGLRAQALVQFKNGVRIQISMPDEYVWPAEAKTETDEQPG